MDINDLPAGTRCLVDANILIFHLNGASIACRDFLRRVAAGEVTAFLTTTIIAETLHRQMLVEAVAKGVVTKSKVLRKLKDQPNLIGRLTDHSNQVRSLLKLPFQTLLVEASDIEKSHVLRNRHHLFVNDSINLACAVKQRIRNIVTHDGDFDRVNSMKIWSPRDI